MTASDGPQWSELVSSVSKAGEVTVRATVTEPLDHDMVLITWLMQEFIGDFSAFIRLSCSISIKYHFRDKYNSWRASSAYIIFIPFL